MIANWYNKFKKSIGTQINKQIIIKEIQQLSIRSNEILIVTVGNSNYKPSHSDLESVSNQVKATFERHSRFKQLHFVVVPNDIKFAKLKRQIKDHEAALEAL